MTDTPAFVTQIDGRTATAGELAPLAFAGFAHFTAMQVRAGRVRGLDLHLERLRSASMRFFGNAMADEIVRGHLRRAIASGPADLSLTAAMFSRSGEFTTGGRDDAPAVLVRTGPPAGGPKGPLRLAAVRNERPLAEIKHTGEAVKTLYLRQAVGEGYDDAAFVDSAGRISEATIWNLAFWDGGTVIWPKAVVLPGVTMGILRRQLRSLDIHQCEREIPIDGVGGFRGAAVMNSWTPGVGIAAVGIQDLPSAPNFIGLLHRAYLQEPMCRV